MDSTNQDVNVTPATQQNPAQNTSTETVNSGSSQSATVPQEHVSKLVGDARKEGKATAIAELLKSLGVASAEELKALKDKATALEQANMTESQKLQAERDALKQEKEEALAQLTAERAERRHDRIAQAISAKAASMKANDTEDVLLYAREKHKDEWAALMDESGAIDDKKLTALLDKIKASKSHYFTPPVSVPGSRSNNEGRVMPSDAKDKAVALNALRGQMKSAF